MQEKNIVRTQVRFPEALHLAVRHVAADTQASFNETLTALVFQALEAHHDRLPKKLLSQLEGLRPTD